jgi:hypothetical protein
VLYGAKTIAELKKLQKAALESNYAYRRLAHLTNNIGPRLTGSPQAAQANNRSLARRGVDNGQRTVDN